MKNKKKFASKILLTVLTMVFMLKTFPVNTDIGMLSSVT